MIRHLSIAALAAAAALALGSCGTARTALKNPAKPVQTVQAQGLTVSLRFRDEASLKRQFGTRANPFLTDYHRLFFRRLVVFELTAENRSPDPYHFELFDCRLDLGEVRTGPIGRSRLGEYWKYLDGDPRVSAEKERIIDRTVLENRTTVAPGSGLHGYLVFLGDLPGEGRATVLVPGPGGGAEQRLRFDYDF